MDEPLQDLLLEKIPEDTATPDEILGIVNGEEDPNHLRMILRRIERFSLSLASNEILLSTIKERISLLESLETN